ncbi:MAG TPA: peptide deformylase [Candidatus Baltobacteraceae bacterium]|nr:peptide deformylase [Candidatus Baltobacteraceae bacterium]
MAALKIAHLGHPVLRMPAEPVKRVSVPDIQRPIDDMLETVQEFRQRGLSAPQVHRSLQIVIAIADTDRSATGVPQRPLVPVNPVIVPVADWTEDTWEHCLSLPGLYGKVPRFSAIEVTAQDRQGQAIAFKATHSLARLIQHEADHLLGKVFLDRMRDLKTLTSQEECARFWVAPPA